MNHVIQTLCFYAVCIHGASRSDGISNDVPSVLEYICVLYKGTVSYVLSKSTLISPFHLTTTIGLHT
jgi:hypothetical protein